MFLDNMIVHGVYQQLLYKSSMRNCSHIGPFSNGHFWWWMISGHFQIHFQEDDHWVLGNKKSPDIICHYYYCCYTCDNNKNRHSSIFWGAHESKKKVIYYTQIWNPRSQSMKLKWTSRNSKTRRVLALKTQTRLNLSLISILISRN